MLGFGQLNKNDIQRFWIFCIHLHFCVKNIYHPKKLTWNLKIMGFYRNLLFKGAPIFRFQTWVFGGVNIGGPLFLKQTFWTPANHEQCSGVKLELNNPTQVSQSALFIP